MKTKTMTATDIAKKFKLVANEKLERTQEWVDDAVRDIESLIAMGLTHGKEGSYKLSDMRENSESDDALTWYWEVGQEVESVEMTYDLPERSVLSVYKDAFKQGCEIAKAEAKAAKNAKKAA
jgi:hypothetical protein